MKLILIDGGPASGKNTLGTLLVKKLKKPGDIVKLLDLDDYVEKINPSWIWEDKQKEEMDLQEARNNYAYDIAGFLRGGFSVIAIGERFLTKDDIAGLISKLNVPIQACYLIHLSLPLEVRKKRLSERGPSVLIDLEKDQRERDSNAKRYGCIYENTNSPLEDAENIKKLIENGSGIIDTTLLK